MNTWAPIFCGFKLAELAACRAPLPAGQAESAPHSRPTGAPETGAHPAAAPQRARNQWSGAPPSGQVAGRRTGRKGLAGNHSPDVADAGWLQTRARRRRGLAADWGWP